MMPTAQRKPLKRCTINAKQPRAHNVSVSEVRRQVFERDHNICRVCSWFLGDILGPSSLLVKIRPATEMHELKFKSLGGKVTIENCIAVCGTHHRALHLHKLWPVGSNANLALSFVAEKGKGGR